MYRTTNGKKRLTGYIEWIIGKPAQATRKNARGQALLKKYIARGVVVWFVLRVRYVPNERTSVARVFSLG